MSIEADAFKNAEATALTKGPSITDVMSAREAFVGSKALDGVSEKLNPFFELAEAARKFTAMSDTGEFSGFMEHIKEQAKKGEPLYQMILGMPIG